VDYPTFNGEETIDSIQEKFGMMVRERLAKDLKKAGFSDFPEDISLLIFKEEKTLELYGKKSGQWNLIKTYPFTATSGQLGPKLQEGDRQIPEGIYRIGYLNPNSKFHLSAKINYPNDFDKKKATLDNRTDLGGDIFIHGNRMTIGCVPVGDRGIEELFLLMANARPRKIEVILSPRDFRKNDHFPKLAHINWAIELYEQIQVVLSNYNHTH
jgi:murein L,D-transpeptidase YafK